MENNNRFVFVIKEKFVFFRVFIMNVNNGRFVCVIENM